jgi:diguanylate cyclase (GGDEF)-like protein
VAVLFLHLDHFKTINDSLGHQAADHALIAIAKRLQGAVCETDILARLGGDEFVILCEDLAGKQETIELSKRIQAVVGAPLALRAQATEISVTVSIGIALSHGGQRAEDLVRTPIKRRIRPSNVAGPAMRC